jgi:hypothetical protein
MTAFLQSIAGNTVFDPMTVYAMMQAYLKAKRLLKERGLQIDDETVARSIMQHAESVIGRNEILVQRVVKSLAPGIPAADFTDP